MQKKITIWSMIIVLVMVTVAAQSSIEAPEADPEDGLELGCSFPVVGFESGLPPTWSATATTHVDWEGFDKCESDLVPQPIANWTGGTGEAMCINSDAYFYENYDARLISNAVTIPTDATKVTLTYKINYQDLTTDPTRDYFDLDISTDNGSNWTTLLHWNEDHGGWGALPGESVTLDLSNCAGQTALVSWRYYDHYDLSWDWYVQVDEAQITCDNGSGTGSSNGVDYGDLAPTIAGAAWHNDTKPRTLWLGNAVDNDANDLEGSDFFTNDGVSVESDWLPGETATLMVKVSENDGWLSGWIDWDNNGVFENPAERVLDEAVAIGDNTLTFPIPADFDPNAKIVARFRLYTAEPADPNINSVAGPTGGVDDGEVEDYIWNRDALAVQLSQFQGSSASNWFMPGLVLAALLLLSLPAAYAKVAAKKRQE